MRFEKWQALGNDYVIVEEAALPVELTEERIKAICAPHFGVGSDGVLLLSPAPEPEYVARLRIFNPDGSEAELSGNGAREAVLYLRESGWTEEDTFSVITMAGPVTPTITAPGTVSMAIGRASVTSSEYPSGPADGTGTIDSAGRSWRFRHVNVGNPQCVIEAGDEVEELDLGEVGPAIESNTDLFPHRTNVSFTARRGLDGPRPHLRARGGGDALLRHRRLRSRRCSLPRRRPESDHRPPRRRSARRRDHGPTGRDPDRRGRAGLPRRARRFVPDLDTEP